MSAPSKQDIIAMTAGQLETTFAKAIKNGTLHQEFKTKYRLTDFEIIQIENTRCGAKPKKVRKDDTSHERKAGSSPINLKGTRFNGFKAGDIDGRMRQKYYSKITSNNKTSKESLIKPKKGSSPKDEEMMMTYQMMKFSFCAGKVVDEVLRTLEIGVARYLRDEPEYTCSRSKSNLQRELSNWIVKDNPGYSSFLNYANTSLKAMNIAANELAFYNLQFVTQCGTQLSLEELLDFTDGPGKDVPVGEKLVLLADLKDEWLSADGKLETVKMKVNKETMEDIHNGCYDYEISNKKNSSTKSKHSAGSGKGKENGKSKNSAGSDKSKESGKSKDGKGKERGKSSKKTKSSTKNPSGKSTKKDSSKKDKAPKKKKEEKR